MATCVTRFGRGSTDLTTPSSRGLQGFGVRTLPTRFPTIVKENFAPSSSECRRASAYSDWLVSRDERWRHLHLGWAAEHQL